MIQKRFSPFHTTEHVIIAVLLSFIIHGMLFLIPVHPIEKPKSSSTLNVKLQPLPSQNSAAENNTPAEKTEASAPDFANLMERLQRIEAEYAAQNPQLSAAREQTKLINEPLQAASIESNQEPNEYINYKPVLLYRPNLRYPHIANINGIEGKVMIAANIAANGSLTDITVKQSSGHGILDDTASRSAAHWRFMPPPAGVTVPVQIPFVFESCYKNFL